VPDSADTDTDAEPDTPPATAMCAETDATNTALAAAVGSLTGAPLTFRDTYKGRRAKTDSGEVRFVIGLEVIVSPGGTLTGDHLSALEAALTVAWPTSFLSATAQKDTGVAKQSFLADGVACGGGCGETSGCQCGVVNTIKQHVMATLGFAVSGIADYISVGRTTIQTRLNGRCKPAAAASVGKQLEEFVSSLRLVPADDAIQDSGGTDARERPPAVNASKTSAYKCRGAWTRACDKHLLMDQGMYNKALCDTGTTHYIKTAYLENQKLTTSIHSEHCCTAHAATQTMLNKHGRCGHCQELHTSQIAPILKRSQLSVGDIQQRTIVRMKKIIKQQKGRIRGLAANRDKYRFAYRKLKSEVERGAKAIAAGTSKRDVVFLDGCILSNEIVRKLHNVVKKGYLKKSDYLYTHILMQLRACELQKKSGTSMKGMRWTRDSIDFYSTLKHIGGKAAVDHLRGHGGGNGKTANLYAPSDSTLRAWTQRLSESKLGVDLDSVRTFMSMARAVRCKMAFVHTDAVMINEAITLAAVPAGQEPASAPPTGGPAAAAPPPPAGGQAPPKPPSETAPAAVYGFAQTIADSGEKLTPGVVSFEDLKRAAHDSGGAAPRKQLANKMNVALLCTADYTVCLPVAKWAIRSESGAMMRAMLDEVLDACKEVETEHHQEHTNRGIGGEFVGVHVDAVAADAGSGNKAWMRARHGRHAGVLGVVDYPHVMKCIRNCWMGCPIMLPYLTDAAPASGSGTAGNVVVQEQSGDENSDDEHADDADADAGADAAAWQRGAGRVKWRAWGFTDLRNLRAFGSLAGPSEANQALAAKFAAAIPLSSLDPPDKQNVADARGVFTEELEELLREHIAGSEPLCNFISMVRSFYETFSKAETPDTSDHATFMAEKRAQLKEIGSYFEIWGRACTSAFGKKKGGAPKGCISACTLDSIAVTCRNVPVLMDKCEKQGIELHMHALSTNTVESFFSCLRQCVKKPTVSDVLRDFHKIGDEMEKKLRGGGEHWVYKFNRKCPYETYILQKSTISTAASTPKKRRRTTASSPMSPARMSAEERKQQQQHLAAMRSWVKEIGGGAGNGKTSRDYNKKQGKCFDPDTVWWTQGEGEGVDYWAVRANYPAMQAVFVLPLEHVAEGQFKLVASADPSWKFQSVLHATTGARHHADGSFTGVRRRVGSTAAVASTNKAAHDEVNLANSDDDEMASASEDESAGPGDEAAWDMVDGAPHGEEEAEAATGNYQMRTRSAVEVANRAAHDAGSDGGVVNLDAALADVGGAGAADAIRGNGTDSDTDDDATLGAVSTAVHKGAGAVLLTPESLQQAEEEQCFGLHAGGTWGRVRKDGKKCSLEQCNSMCEKCNQEASKDREHTGCDYCNVVYCSEGCLGSGDTNLEMMGTNGVTWCCPDCWRPAANALYQVNGNRRAASKGLAGAPAGGSGVRIRVVDGVPTVE
jgi:hypothetical protein